MFEHGDALLVIDVLNDFRHEDAGGLMVALRYAEDAGGVRIAAPGLNPQVE